MPDIFGGSLSVDFTEDDNLYGGFVSPQTVLGEEEEDPDLVFHGTVSLFGGGGGQVVCRLYVGDNIVGGGDFINLADEITLVEQGANAEGNIDDNTT